MTPEEIKTRLQKIVDHTDDSTPVLKETAKEAKKLIEELEQKPLVKKDTLITNK